MIGFVIKACLTLAAVVGGSVLLVNNVPYLKANVLEVVNPRVQEGKLVEQLNTTLTKLDDATTSAARDKLITESKALLQDITDLNEEHSGVVDGIISNVTDALLGTPPSPKVSEDAAIATPAVVTVTVTVTVTPVPSPCR